MPSQAEKEIKKVLFSPLRAKKGLGMLTGGGDSRAIVGAALYVAADRSGERKTKTRREIARAVGVTEHTISEGALLLQVELYGAELELGEETREEAEEKAKELLAWTDRLRDLSFHLPDLVRGWEKFMAKFLEEELYDKDIEIRHYNLTM